MNTYMSISQAKRNISELVNRVNYTGERIILTSRGKPKAVLISIEDYERLPRNESRTTDIKNWLAETREFSNKIEKRRGGPVDVDIIFE
jgi:prevent-host-death family protein